MRSAEPEAVLNQAQVWLATAGGLVAVAEGCPGRGLREVRVRAGRSQRRREYDDAVDHYRHAPADRGTVEVAVPRRQVAVCPDVPEFDGWLTAFEVVDLARSMVAPERGSYDVLGALRTAGLGDAARRRAGGFSRGSRPAGRPSAPWP